jgi:hypothetical protein
LASGLFANFSEIGNSAEKMPSFESALNFQSIGALASAWRALKAVPFAFESGKKKLFSIKFMKIAQLVVVVVALLALCQRVSGGNERGSKYRSIEFIKTDGLELEYQGVNTDDKDAFADEWRWQAKLEEGRQDNGLGLLNGEFGYYERVVGRDGVGGASGDQPPLAWLSFQFRIVALLEYAETNGVDGYQSGDDELVQRWADEVDVDWSNGRDFRGWLRRDGVGSEQVGVFRFHARTDTPDGGSSAAGYGQLRFVARAAPARTHVDGVDVTCNEVNLQIEIDQFPFVRVENGDASSKLAVEVWLRSARPVQLGPGDPTEIQWIRALDRAEQPAQPDGNTAVHADWFWRNRVDSQMIGDGDRFDQVDVHCGTLAESSIDLGHNEYRWTMSIIQSRHYDLYKWQHYFSLHYDYLEHSSSSSPSASLLAIILSLFAIAIVRAN